MDVANRVLFLFTSQSHLPTVLDMTIDTTTKFPLARPELRPFLENFPGFECGPNPADGVRVMLSAFPPPPMPDPEVVTMSNVEITRADRSLLRLLVLRPTNAKGKALPVVLCAHGGGGIMAPPELDLPFYTFLAEKGYLVVSPDYRLAPEHRSPAALDDVHTAYKYVTSSNGAAEVGADAGRIALYGSSAGGGLVAGLAIRLNQANEPLQPAITILDCPGLDDRMIYPTQADGHPTESYHIWTKQNAIDATRHVFGDSDERTAEIAPLRFAKTDALKGLGPHHVSWADLDVFADHGPAYADALKAAGVSCERREWAGTIHVFMTLQPGSDVAKEAQRNYLMVLQRYLPL